MPVSKRWAFQMFAHVDARMDILEGLLRQALRQEGGIMDDLTALTTQVATNTSVEQSALTLITGLAAKLAASANDPAAIAALAQQLNASGVALAAAVAANTLPPDSDATI